MSLIKNEESFIKSIRGMYELSMSASFACCANVQLSEIFIKLTGLKPAKNIALAYDPMAPTDFTPDKLYVKDEISGIVLSIAIRAYVFRVFVMWDSVSGKQYDIADADIPCEDIRFWFYKLEPLAYRRHLEKEERLPFKSDGFGFVLKVSEIGVNATFELQVRETKPENVSEMINSIDGFLEKFQIPAKRKEDVLCLHNWRHEWKPDEAIIEYSIDTGLTGYFFYEAFLKHLSTMQSFESVTIS
jgi:hypothetical protein